jgi:uncharacterized membrane protein
MKLFFSTYGLTLLFFAIVDFIWLSLMTERLYRPLMGALLADTFKIGPAIAFYMLYGLGVTLFVVIPSLKGQLSQYGLPEFLAIGFNAALLGVFAYGTYNLTGWAVIEGWSARLALIDMAWGATLTTLTVYGAIFTGRMLKLS